MMGVRNPVMLIRIKPSDMPRVVKRQGQESFNFGEFFAYTKVCSHLGCPSSLYEQQSYRILCPCHQSQFDALHFAKPIFGPAARALAQLPITIDTNGYLVANGDFIEPVGPAFWERTTHESETRVLRNMGDVLARQGEDIDTRYHPSAAVRRQLNKVFPTHWSFLLGEIALYTFIVLLITGVYLTLFFDPSMAEVTYNGVYQPLRGVEMSRAYESALDISFEVRGGLFVRQIHHWAALMFSAAIMVHLARIFFTGAFRRPREANWVIGSLLLILSMFEGYFGYSLPDDLLSGIGLRAALSSITLGMPVIGTWLHWALFGGDFPGDHPDSAAVRAAHPADSGHHPGADRGAPGVGVVPEAHPVPRPRSHRAERRRRARDAGVRGQVRRVLRDDRRHPRPDGRPAADQPDLEAGALQAISGVGRLAARLLHDVDRGPGPYLAAVGVLLLAPHHPRGRSGWR